jgi:hypothetical protein
MPSLDDVLKDPDFWGDKTTDDDRKWALSQVDKKFATYSPTEQDRFIKNRAVARQQDQQQQAKEHEDRASQVLPKIQESQQKKTMWEQAVAPLTQAVGRGVEIATAPLVPLARLAQGEGAQSFSPEYRTASHPPTAGQVGASVVPQTPWQAGAMAAQAVPGIRALGTGARVASSAIGGGGLQALLGSQGLLEGGSQNEAALEGLTGAAKGAGTQLAGEAAGKLLGAATRIPGTGRARRMAQADVSNVQRAVGDIAPEFGGAGRTTQQLGAFYTGTQGAKKAAGAEFEAGINALERQLLATQGHPYINVPELHVAFNRLAKIAKSEPGLDAQIQALAPAQNGFLPEQVAKIISLTGERLKAGQTGMGHLKDAAMDDLVKAVESSLPSKAQNILTGVRAQYAKGVGLKELMEQAFTPGRKGYDFDMRKLQTALSENPDLANRIPAKDLEALLKAATRGKSGQPGFADLGAGNIASVPGSPSTFSLAAAALRNMLRSGKHIGELPGTISPRLKQLLGVSATSQASQQTKRSEQE